MRRAPAVLAMLLLAASLPFAATAQGCDAETIPRLIAMVGPDGTARVPPGTYCGDIDLPPNTILEAIDGPAVTTIVGGTYGVHMAHGEYMTVQGFTITGAARDGIYQDDPHHGGAITIDDNVFVGNGGWGINLFTMHDILLHDNLFAGNGLGGARMAGEMRMLMSVEFHRQAFVDEPVGILFDEGINVRVIDSTFRSVGTGVVVRAFDVVRIYRNLFEDVGVGVDVAGACPGGAPSDVINTGVFDNVFRDVRVGVQARGGLTGCSGPYGVYQLRIVGNAFEGQADYAVDATTNVGVDVVVARRNHWGSDLGPTPLAPQAAPFGQRVSAGVDFAAWCLSLGCPPPS